MRGTVTIDRKSDRGQAEAGTLIALTIGLVVAVTMISVLIPVVNDNSGQVAVTNESVTSSLSYNTTYELTGYDLVSGSETVYVENGTAGSFETLSSSEYTLDESGGSLNVTGQTGSSAGDEVQITYDYNATDTTVETLLDLLALFLALIALVAISDPIQRRL